MKGASRTRGYDERGSATLLSLASALLLLTASVACALWAAVSIGHHRAAAAADLSALSAAQALQSGADRPCDTASRITTDQRVELLGCRVEGDTVVVVAAVRLRLGVLGSPYTKSAARAGPVGSGSNSSRPISHQRFNAEALARTPEAVGPALAR
jgi:secretion/DNA translocation related TadE-like protein